MMATFLRDLDELAAVASSPGHRVSRLQMFTRSDSPMVLALFRLPSTPLGRHVPLLRWGIRRLITAAYGLELGRDIELGPGVHFVHTLGTVVGGTARIGARVRFYGNNTVGTARDNGYPVIEEDVQLGCGARVLGPVRIGARSVIGANAVVLTDVPPDSVVVGVPGHVVNSHVVNVKANEVPV